MEISAADTGATETSILETDPSLLDTDSSLLDRALEVGGWGRQAVILLAVALALWQIVVFITGAIFRGRSSLPGDYRDPLLWQITAQHTFDGAVFAKRLVKWRLVQLRLVQ